jgi:predicted transcriptional regulator
LKILKLLLEDKRPLSMAVIAEKTGISEVTTARICNELAAEGRIVWNTVGPAKVFRVVDDQKVAEVLNSAPLYGSNNT